MRPRKAPPAVNLSLSLSEGVRPDWFDDALGARIRDIASGLEPDDAVVELVIVDDPYITRLNNRYRQQDRATDVISFSYLDDVEAARDELAGEIYISADTLSRDADASGVDVRHLFLRLGVHGLLHVLGRDHATETEAEQMEAEERRVLAGYLSAEAVDALF